MPLMISLYKSQPTRRRFIIASTACGALLAKDASFDKNRFSPEAKAKLGAILGVSGFRGRVPASDVALLMKTENVSRSELMTKMLPVAQSLAHPPLSNYFVGAIALGSSGNLYLGANIEVPGNMLGLAVHAEQSAIANAYMSDEPGVEAIAVTAAPCGHCRQFLSEVSVESSMRVLVANAAPVMLSDLLPSAFGPKDLGFKQGAFPVRRVQMTIAESAAGVLAREALKAACMSYSPYTRSPSGVALSTSSGRVFAGSYIENAAFNPSLPPLEAALAGYFAAGKQAGTIQRVVLVEKAKNQISHRVTTQSVLAALAPSARLDLISAKE